MNVNIRRKKSLRFGTSCVGTHCVAWIFTCCVTLLEWSEPRFPWDFNPPFDFLSRLGAVAAGRAMLELCAQFGQASDGTGALSPELRWETTLSPTPLKELLLVFLHNSLKKIKSWSVTHGETTFMVEAKTLPWELWPCIFGQVLEGKGWRKWTGFPIPPAFIAILLHCPWRNGGATISTQEPPKQHNFIWCSVVSCWEKWQPPLMFLTFLLKVLP